MLSIKEAILLRAILARTARGETVDAVLASYTALDEETKERVLFYVERD